MRIKKTVIWVVSLMAAGRAFSSGFALYQPTALGHALGGTLVGSARDASANYINPATLTDLTNITLTAGFVTEHPRCKIKVNGGREESLDPGLFWLPHFQLAVPLPYDFAAGLGLSPEYGLGTHYSRSWSMAWNSTETTVQGYVINPNLAYRITDDWSVGAGLRWLFFDFEQYSNPNQAIYLDSLNPAYPHTYYGTARVRNRLKGDNGFKDFGFSLGTKYDITDDLSVGLVYKSRIETTIEGRCRTLARSRDELSRTAAVQATGDAEADLTIPQSITFGANWDVTDRVSLGCAAAWTEWSQLDHLLFHMPPADHDVQLGWSDTWRFSLGGAYEFIDDWTFLLSYVYDMDSTSSHQDSTMLPPADRHILAGGLDWRFNDHLSFTLSYSCIFMDGDSMLTNDPRGGTGEYYLKSSDGFCHAGGFSITYRF